MKARHAEGSPDASNSLTYNHNNARRLISCNDCGRAGRGC